MPSRYWEEGYYAFLDCRLRTENPYEEFTTRGQEWFAGWYAAYEESFGRY